MDFLHLGNFARAQFPHNFRTAYAIASAIFPRSSSVWHAEIAVRTKSFPGGTAGAMDITVNTPFSSKCCQNRYARYFVPSTMGTAGVSLPHVSSLRPCNISL